MKQGHRSSIDNEWTVTLPPDVVASLYNQPDYSGGNHVYIRMLDGGRLGVYSEEMFQKVSGTMEMVGDISPDMKEQSRRLHALASKTELAADGSVNIPKRMRWEGDVEIVACDGYVEIRKPGGTYPPIDEQAGKRHIISPPAVRILKPSAEDTDAVKKSRIR